jgi:hypothetical protein
MDVATQLKRILDLNRSIVYCNAIIVEQLIRLVVCYAVIGKDAKSKKVKSLWQCEIDPYRCRIHLSEMSKRLLFCYIKIGLLEKTGKNS